MKRLCRFRYGFVDDKQREYLVRETKSLDSVQLITNNYRRNIIFQESENRSIFFFAGKVPFERSMLSIHINLLLNRVILISENVK